MADNSTPDPKSGSQPPLPSSGTTGRLPSPTTHLPVKKGGVGKIVVMLSSVAKPPPAGTQTLSRVAPLSDASPKLSPADPSQVVRRPPPLPPKQVSPGYNTQPPARLSATTYVKLPPKTSEPRWSSLSGAPIATPGDQESPASKATPPPLPAKSPEPVRSEPRKSGAQHIPPIKLNELASETDDSGESIFLEADQPAPAPKPDGWKNLEPGELNPPKGDLQSLEVFARSQRILGKPAPETPLPEPEAKDPSAPLVAPPLLPPSRVEHPASATGPGQPARPPSLPPPLAKFAEGFTAPPPPLQVAPPLVEKAPEPPGEKLPPPQLPAEARKGETDLSESTGVLKAPALIQPEAPPAKPLLPPTPPTAKGTGNWLKKKTTPIVLSSTSKIQVPWVVEDKPALKPAVLPKRLLPLPKEDEAEATEPAEKSNATAATALAALAASAAQATGATPPAQPPGTGTPPFGEKEKAEAMVLPDPPPPDAPVSLKAKRHLPETRATRAHKRRVWEVVGFYLLFAVTVLALFFGTLHFCQETRVEGQVIPPPGMALNNEVWIVNDFSSEVSGITEDLAAERTPLMQEIQERRDHVQRAQADVASREERIRLINEEIQAAKDQVAALVKQSRDATQQVWDVDGAQIDAEHEARLDQLQKEIADRAKSLKLNYQPDDSYHSPEVWANAYRLALYDVPAGVDSVKEHQWLEDQMKQWRAFLKTLDDRTEQLREKAAQIKLEPASKITDLNTKIEELQQRIDGTAAEEVPLKAELQQAQADLATAQASDAGLDDKYYKELEDRPAANIINNIRIPVATNGRFTWVDDASFVEDEKEHHYWIFSRATRADGRQYWALHHFNISKNQTIELIIEPAGFISTKAILRPDLSPEEQEQ